MSASFDQKVEFIKSALEHAERRIGILDQKASILMAIQGGFLVLVLALFKDYLGNYFQLFEETKQLQIISNLFVFISLSLTFYVIILLVLTIRPKLKFFSRSMPYAPIEANNYIFWFDRNRGNLVTHTYEDAFNQLSEEDILNNYKKAHLTSLRLVERKYKFYRKAIDGMNYLIIWNVSGILFLLVFTMF